MRTVSDVALDLPPLADIPAPQFCRDHCDMNSEIDLLNQLPETRRQILLLLKHRGRATTMELAQDLGLSHEAVRRHLIQLSQEGFIKTECPEDDEEGKLSGRPPVAHCLTAAGDHFFPKRYDELATLFIDAASDDGGGEVETLARITKQRAARLPTSTRAELKDRVRTLQSVYLEGDPYLEVRRDGDDYLIVEKNCVFLNVALERPAICSTTVSLMRQILGVEVVREERFQDDDGRCTFRVVSDRPVSTRRRRRFEFEPPKDAARRNAE